MDITMCVFAVSQTLLCVLNVVSHFILITTLWSTVMIILILILCRGKLRPSARKHLLWSSQPESREERCEWLVVHSPGPTLNQCALHLSLFISCVSQVQDAKHTEGTSEA